MLEYAPPTAVLAALLSHLGAGSSDASPGPATSRCGSSEEEGEAGAGSAGRVLQGFSSQQLADLVSGERRCGAQAASNLWRLSMTAVTTHPTSCSHMPAPRPQLCSLRRILGGSIQGREGGPLPCLLTAFFDSLDTVLGARLAIANAMALGLRARRVQAEVVLTPYHVGSICGEMGRLAAMPGAALT